MKVYIIKISFLIACCLCSCYKKIAPPTSNTKELIINSEISTTNIGDSFVIDSITISKDILSIYVNYSGGCKTHDFTLYFNGKYAKSLPLQTTLSLVHNKNNDNCKMLKYEELKFNIFKVRHQDVNTIILKVGNKNIMYNY